MTNAYEAVRTFLLALPSVQHAWAEVPSLLQAAASRRPRDWMLPVHASVAVGGDIAGAIPLMAATACLQQSIILLDDMLDNDPRGYFRTVGLPHTANLASTLQTIAMEAVLQGNGSGVVKLAVLHRLNGMIASVAHGQQMDVGAVTDEPTYWQIVAHKSAPFYGELLATGAIAGGASAGTIDALQTFGAFYGIMIQLHDDLNDVMATPANPDWTEGRAPLPLLYATLVAHPEQAHFRTLRARAHDPLSLREAQAILIRSGAISYCLYHLLEYEARCRAILHPLTLKQPEPLLQLLETIMAPVYRMFSMMDTI